MHLPIWSVLDLASIRKDMHMKIAVVGLGYVGLPLSLQFARNGIHVLGLDVDQKKVGEITTSTLKKLLKI